MVKTRKDKTTPRVAKTTSHRTRFGGVEAGEGVLDRASLEERVGIECMRCTRHAVLWAGALSSSPLRTCGIAVCAPCCSAIAPRSSDACEWDARQEGMRIFESFARRVLQKERGLWRRILGFGCFPAIPPGSTLEGTYAFERCASKKMLKFSSPKMSKFSMQAGYIFYLVCELLGGEEGDEAHHEGVKVRREASRRAGGERRDEADARLLHLLRV